MSYIFQINNYSVQDLVYITMINVEGSYPPPSSQSYQRCKRELTQSKTPVRNDPRNILTALPPGLFPVLKLSPLWELRPPDTRLALARSDSRLYIVFFTLEYSVPGIIMKQEKTVCWERVWASWLWTDTSYIMPLLTVVVLVSPITLVLVWW